LTAVAAAVAPLAATVCVSAAPVPTTLDDFFNRGTQPVESGQPFDEILTNDWCRSCHSPQDPDTPIFDQWQGTLMAQAARDPLFWACLAVANQDAAEVGDLCIRCHSPKGWLEGRSTPTDGSALTADDRDGVTCNFCHRLVNPVYEPGVSPAVDEAIVDDLDLAGLLPTSLGNASYVFDPEDRRRGPFDIVADMGFDPHNKPTQVSPFHTRAQLCENCHDVSNPVYTRAAGGRYVLNDLGQAHPTLDKHDMFPIERTYSEWVNSAFPAGVDMGGRFGGNITVVSTCQDCHMPRITARGCFFAGVRPNLPAHEFSGAATWVLQAVLNLNPTAGIFPENIAAGIARSISMLQRAATLELSQVGGYLNVRVINETGHKLPTGYPEGRRMWVRVRFQNAFQQVIGEHGAYDNASAELTTNTRIYQARLGVDEAVAALTGIPEGVGFHFALNNVVYQDNRIPPRGFTRAGFAAVGAATVGADYVDGQHWDDSRYFIPPGAVYASAVVYYQSASKEYITFLRDENVTNDAGDVLYDQWVATGKSAPILMDAGTLPSLSDHPRGDYDDNGVVDLADYAAFPSCMLGPDVSSGGPCSAFDCDADGDVDMPDYQAFQISRGYWP